MSVPDAFDHELPVEDGKRRQLVENVDRFDVAVVEDVEAQHEATDGRA